MKSLVFWLKFHWSLFPGVQLIITQHWFRKWLGAGQATSHYLNQWWPSALMYICITHWCRVRHICVSKRTIIGSDNGLSPGRCQAIIWNNAGILLIGPLGTNFSEIQIEIQNFSLIKMHFKLCAIWRPFCTGPNVLICNAFFCTNATRSKI